MSGLARCSLTVKSSTFSIAPSRAPKISRVCSSWTVVPSSFFTSPMNFSSPFFSMSGAIRVAIELLGTWLSHQRARLKTTSSAVKASPLVHWAVLRTCSVYSVASVIDFPALDQPRLESEVGGIAHQGLAEQPRLVAFLRPVEDPRIVEPHHRLGDLDGAAGGADRVLGADRSREAEHRVGGRAGHPERRGGGQELAAAELALARFLGKSRYRGMHRLAIDGRCAHHLLPLASLVFGPRGIAELFPLHVNR